MDWHLSLPRFVDWGFAVLKLAKHFAIVATAVVIVTGQQFIAELQLDVVKAKIRVELKPQFSCLLEALRAYLAQCHLLTKVHLGIQRSFLLPISLLL